MKTLLFLLALCFPAFGEDVATTLAWDANPEPDVIGYRLYVGFAHGIYGTSLDVRATEKTITYPAGSLLYVAVTAVNATGQESPKSEELVFQNNTAGGYTTPSAPATIRIKQQVKVTIQNSIDLQHWQDVSTTLLAVADPQMFFRLQIGP
jgi:hypothetical protein